MKDMTAPVALVPYWTYLVPVFIAGITMIQVIILAYINAKFNAVRNSVKSTEVLAAETADSADKIHTIVNSQKTAMEKELRDLRETVESLRIDKARKESKKRV